MNTPRNLLLVLTLGLLLLAATPAAWADEGDAPPEATATDAASSPAEDAAARAPGKPGPGGILLSVLLVAVVVSAGGCLLAVLRVIFPGPAAKADGALARLTTGRLLLTGMLPLVGVLLLGTGAAATGVPLVQGIWGILFALPLGVLSLVGAMAAIPHLGSRLLRGGDTRSLLARSITGSLALGFGVGVIGGAVPPLGILLALIVFGWFLGAGLGIVFAPREAGTADAEQTV